MTNPQHYLDHLGRVLTVGQADRGPRAYGTFYRQANGTMKRLTGGRLPLRPTPELAQRDLDDYAAYRGWKKTAKKP